MSLEPTNPVETSLVKYAASPSQRRKVVDGFENRAPRAPWRSRRIKKSQQRAPDEKAPPFLGTPNSTHRISSTRQ
jgi:hypothetical protein